MFRDDVVQLRLREFRFIAFVVTVPAVTQQIDENIFPKLLAVFYGQI
jgi:hypothetical protein